MQTMKILGAAALSPVLLSAMVFASTTSLELTGEPAKAPNRAEVFAARDCGLPVFRVAADVQSWQNALAAKRRHDHVLTPAAASVKDCVTTDR